ncbi:unnamed protein product [Allacma fusca]|uniref:Uncharacterized protein n=1 Tax=Allacma fusca TaxID=39272 RepID=A0A8J2PQ43_9HEXA|nr:unnamed protein product [Allacma fusca]
MDSILNHCLVATCFTGSLSCTLILDALYCVNANSLAVRDGCKYENVSTSGDEEENMVVAPELKDHVEELSDDDDEEEDAYDDDEEEDAYDDDDEEEEQQDNEYVVSSDSIENPLAEPWD